MPARAFRAVDRTVEFVLFAMFLAFTLVGGLQVFNRFVLGLPLSWSEEFQKFGHIWMVMLAIPVAYRRGAHLGMDMLLRLLPASVQRAVGLVTEVLWLILALAIGRYALVIMDVAKSQDSPGLGIPMDRVYAGMVIGSAYLAFVALRRIAMHLGWTELPPDPLDGKS
jgi:TRAP-type C4-dicarboxylate transport system permease small subunit